MTSIKVPNSEVQELLSGKKYTYPKYVTQILNLANQNAQGTRARIVGQMSDLIQEFDGTTLPEWEQWYAAKHPNAIEQATDRVLEMVEAFKKNIVQIDREMVRQWVEELVVLKTFAGLKFQQVILQQIAARLGKEYRLAAPGEESRGIDGFLANKPVSIKPVTYKVMMGLSETIDVPIVFYEKRKSDLVIEFNPEDFI